MKTIRNAVAGLFLWHVTLADADQNLWITSRRNSLSDVAKKADLILHRMKRNGTLGIRARIERLEYKGFIDG